MDGVNYRVGHINREILGLPVILKDSKISEIQRKFEQKWEIQLL